MRAVNLLPRDAERASAERTRAPFLVLVAGLGVVTAAAVALVFSTSGTVSDRRADLHAAESALRLSSPSSGQAGAAQGVVTQERTDRVAALAAALSSRVPLDGLLRQLAYVLPTDAWLTGLTATSADDSTPGSSSSAASGSSGTPTAGTPVPSATSLTIEGATFSQESVARLLARLAVLPSLEDVRLTKSERVDPQAAAQPGADAAAKPAAAKKQRSIVTFSITAAYSKVSA